MAYILRIGYRHPEAIRCQTIAVTMGLNWSKRRFDFREWLGEQAPHLLETLDRISGAGLDDIPQAFQHERQWHYSMLLNTILFFYELRSNDSTIRARLTHSRVSTTLSDHPEEDYAGAGKGGSWDSDPFPFQAGIIMRLGTLEEFERGSLRILTAIQHAGVSHIGAAHPFRPRLADFQASNPVWDKHERRRSTFTASSRMRLFGTFGIQKPDTKWRRRLDRAWKRRNQIAHGLVPVKATLAMFLRTHYDAFAAMRWLSRTCRKAQNLLL
jgi:hypothetical protein